MSKFQVGDWVMVRKPAHFDELPGWLQSKLNLLVIGGVRKIVAVDFYELEESKKVFDYKLDHVDYVKFGEDSLEPFYPDEPDPTWVPEGHTVIPIAVPDAMANDIGDGNALVWKQPKLGMNYLCPTTSHVRCATEDFSKCYPTATYTTPPAPKYREPTAADVGKMVEVSDIKACLNEAATCWIEAELLAVLPKDVPARFVAYRLDPGFWKYARIKNEEAK